MKRFRRPDPRLVVGVLLLGTLVALALAVPLLPLPDPESIDGSRMLLGPSGEHPFGTDALGRDVLSRVVHALRISLFVAVGSVSLALLLGVPLGLLAGFAGGWVDTIVMRPIDMILVLPALLLAISLIAVFGAGTGIALVAIAVVFFPILARVMRSSAQVTSTLPFVEASRARGMGRLRIALEHVLPNAIGPVLIQSALLMGFALQVEAALSFLGLGTQPPTPSLGRMLFEGRDTLVQAPWAEVFPGLAIAVCVLAFTLIGDGSRGRPRLATSAR